MTEQLISPGVLSTENDTSFITKGPVTVGAAILGPTAKGPVNLPTVVTNYTEYEALFGSSVISGSRSYNYLTSISANNYFQQGGDSLLVTRIVTGSFSPATSDIKAVNGSQAFKLQTISEGVIMNSEGTESASGALVSGSKDNFRWEINYSDANLGTFNLLIRRGDDTTKNKIVLESWRGLSLDPESPNYIERVLGNTTYTITTDGGDSYVRPTGTFPNKSKYVIVKDVVATPNYFDNDGIAKDALKSFLPTTGSGSFSGAAGSLFKGIANFYENINASNTQGLKATDYDDAIQLLSNKDEYQFNIITAPGLTAEHHGTQVNALVALAEGRTDCIAVIDLTKFGSEISTAVTNVAAFDSSYAATYWPWLQTIDTSSGKAVWIPASTMIPGVYAFTDSSSEPWFAPAGMTRGILGRVISPERKLTNSNRDTLYRNNINPITFFPQNGVVVYGQKTTQKKSSSLDRINVRRLLISSKSYISQVANTLVFEQNTNATRNAFLAQVNPYLETIQQRQGLYAFKVVMDDTNNDAASIDRNELRGQIYLQPTKTIEYILLDFNITPTGVEFGNF